MSAIIKTSTGPVVTVTAYHEEFFTLAETGFKANATMQTKGVALIKSKYVNPTPRFPSYNEWENDIAAIKSVAESKKKDPQWHLKVYRACFVEVFGALPVSMDVDAIRVRDSRMDAVQKEVHDKALKEATDAGKSNGEAMALAVHAAKKKTTQKKQAKPGAPANETKDQKASVGEAMEQYIAQFGAQGIFIALDAVTRILASEKATEAKAKSLTSIRNQLARELKPAEQKQA